jgi:hypothetical protein
LPRLPDYCSYHKHPRTAASHRARALHDEISKGPGPDNAATPRKGICESITCRREMPDNCSQTISSL